MRKTLTTITITTVTITTCTATVNTIAVKGKLIDFSIAHGTYPKYISEIY